MRLSLPLAHPWDRSHILMQSSAKSKQKVWECPSHAFPRNYTPTFYPKSFISQYCVKCVRPGLQCYCCCLWCSFSFLVGQRSWTFLFNQPFLYFVFVTQVESFCSVGFGITLNEMSVVALQQKQSSRLPSEGIANAFTPTGWLIFFRRWS